MPENSKYGTIWQDDELDLIVADYFNMLSADMAGRRYVKSAHSSDLMAKTGRSHRSVEFKHQNISAVLDELGIPYIPGYKPKLNFQNAIFDAVERYLEGHTSVLSPEASPYTPLSQIEDAFVPAPIKNTSTKQIPERLRRLVSKFDPVERDNRNRVLGKAGEAYVVELEKERLLKGDRPELARRVRWIADEEGDGAGFDVSSFSFGGEPRFIEVKTTNGSSRTPFFLSRNEYQVAALLPDQWQIYRVHLFATTPRVFTIKPPLESSLILSTETWRASF